MYTIKGGWVGQTFALASSNDSGGKKSRIRRSKEERKTMVESFIKKYQKLNNGNFPSLNLTHKEVGGSFYTVREIVREVIQENRVLGPAKFPMEEQNDYKLLEQFPLVSIAVEPQSCLSPSEETHVTSPVTFNQYPSKSQEDILDSNGQHYGSEHQRLLLDSEQVVNGSNVAIEEGFNSEGPTGTRAISDDHQVTNAEQLSSSIEQLNEPNHLGVNNDTANVTIQEDEESEEPILVSAMPIPSQESSQEYNQETNKERVLCSEVEYAGNGSLVSKDDEDINETSQALEKTNECGEPTDRREIAEDALNSVLVQTNGLEVSNGRTGMTMPIPSQESIQEYNQETNKEQVLCSEVEYVGNGSLVSKDDEDINETSQALEKTNECGEPTDRREIAEDALDSVTVQTNGLEVSNGRTGMKADVLVEKFPLRPVVKTIHDFEVALSEQYKIPKTSEAGGVDHDKTNSSHSGNVEDDADLAGSRLEKISELLEEKAVLNFGDSPLGSSEFSTTKETLEAQFSTLVGEKPINVTEGINTEENINSLNSSDAFGQPILEESTARKSRIKNQQDSSNKKESSSTLNRINLETWERATQKPVVPESNPLVALFKAFINAFVKFWNE